MRSNAIGALFCTPCYDVVSVCPALAVRYTLAVDVHFPLMMEPFALLDEGACYGSVVATLHYAPCLHHVRVQVRAASILSVETLTGLLFTTSDRTRVAKFGIITTSPVRSRHVSVCRQAYLYALILSPVMSGCRLERSATRP